jgi:hypothetical protein
VSVLQPEREQVWAGLATTEVRCVWIFRVRSPGKYWRFPLDESKDGPENSKRIVCLVDAREAGTSHLPRNKTASCLSQLATRTAARQRLRILRSHPYLNDMSGTFREANAKSKTLERVAAVHLHVVCESSLPAGPWGMNGRCGASRVQFAPYCPGRKPPFWAVKRPARPYKTATQKRFTVENAKGA